LLGIEDTFNFIGASFMVPLKILPEVVVIPLFLNPSSYYSKVCV